MPKLSLMWPAEPKELPTPALEHHILFEWFLMEQDKKEGRMKVESILKISLPVLDDYDPIRRLCQPHPTTESNLQVS